MLKLLNAVQKLIFTNSQWQCASFVIRYRNVKTLSNEVNAAGIFRGKLDRFQGITINSVQEYDANIDFSKKLQKSLDYWTSSNKYRAIWFKVQREHADWIPLLTKYGFDFHHANAKDNTVVLNRWLATNERVQLPSNDARMMISVGGLVINAKNEILTVIERYPRIPNSWKIPGGYVNCGEKLLDAVKREVFEETGIDTEYETLVSILQFNDGAFGCSHIHFVIALKPRNLELHRFRAEIKKLQWMPIEKFLTHPEVYELNRHFAESYLNYKTHGIQFNHTFDTHKVLNIDYCLYDLGVCRKQKNETN